MNRSSRIGWVIVPAAVLVLALGSSAQAQNVYSACFKISKNKIRPGSMLVNATPICKSTEQLVTWNEEGPQGPSGTANCAPEEFLGTNNPNTFSVLNAACSTGNAMSGSAIWHTPFDAADNGPFYFFPRSGNLWTIITYNHTSTVQEYRFFLQCCS
jgi:hypothetical protein